MKIKIKRLKIFLHGFDYGVRNCKDQIINLLNSWNSNEQDNKLYRQGIAFGRTYGYYRMEFLAIFVLLFTVLIFMFTW
jgi:hypothetical protein